MRFALRDHRAQQEHRKIAEQLVHAQKMEAVANLAGGVAHDVNNVLAAVSLLSEMALDQINGRDFERAKSTVGEIMRAQESAARIVRQLLMFSKQRCGPAIVVDFAESIQSIQPLLARMVGESVQITVETPDEPLPVQADPTQLEQIVLNLAVNARDAMPSGGNLEFSIRSEVLDVMPENILISAHPGKFVVLTARDSGGGIPAELCRRIFEPFFTTKEVGKGTGLGLSVTYGIIRQVGGTLSVESIVGQGTTFKVYWPLAQGVKMATHAASTTDFSAGVLPESMRILLVEDEPSLRLPLVATLRKKGFTVYEAVNGEEALRLVRDLDTELDLLITDVVMPRIGGPELMTKARETRPEIKVLFLSGYADDTLKSYDIDFTATWFLGKPFTSKDFLNKVAEVLQSAPAPQS